ncbi:MAG: LysR substrate-binding domain-containing protein [Polaromonas sp.]
MARNLNFQQIEAFKAVMQLGTTTSAALMLNTTQPSISRRIAELQSATELKLFDLHHGRLRPTSEGTLLYKTIQQHFDGLEKIESVVAIMRRSGTQVLRLGCTPTLGIGLLPLVVNQFLQKFPETHINIHTLSSQQLGDFLHQGLIDLALTTGELNDSDFRPVVINTTEAVCVLPLNHRLKDFPVIDFSMLHGERLLSISETDELTVKIKAQLAAHGIPVEFAVQTASSITVCALVAAGNGVGMVNPYVASTFAGQLLIRPLTPPIAIPVRMAMPMHTAPSLLTRHFVDLLLQQEPPALPAIVLQARR